MKMTELKVARIGNSRGVRLPAPVLQKYKIGSTLIMEEHSDGLLLRPVGPTTAKLTWSETARAMAAAGEDWSAWEATLSDGLESIPWSSKAERKAAEPSVTYTTRPRKRSGP